MSEIAHQTEIVEKETCGNCGGMGEIWVSLVGRKSTLARCSVCSGQGFTTETRQLTKTGLEVREEKPNEPQK